MLLWSIFNASCAFYHSRNEQEYIEIFLFPELEKINLFLNFIWELLYSMFLRKLPLLDGSLIPQNYHKSFSLVYIWIWFGRKIGKRKKYKKNTSKLKNIAKFVFLFLFLLGNGGSISGDHQCISSSVNFTDKLIRSFLQFRVTFDIIKLADNLLKATSVKNAYEFRKSHYIQKCTFNS